MKKKAPVNYVNNKQFFQCIVDWKEQCAAAEAANKERPMIPEYAGHCIKEIANRFSQKYSYRDYSFRDEMISDAIENCIMYFHDFNPEKSKNPFAYFTQITYYAFLRRIAKEEKNRYIIYKNFDQNIAMTGMADLWVDEKKSLLSEPIYDNISNFIGRFEAKEAEKKAKKQAKAKAKGLEELMNENDDD